MASELLRTEERDGETINIYKSGAEYNFTRKKLIRPADHTIITAENTTEYNRRRQELARAAFVEGANNATAEKLPEFLPAGELAYVRAIGYVTQQKAMNDKDAKQPEAAKLALNIGERLGETKTVETMRTNVNVLVMPENVATFFEDVRKRLDSQVVRTDLLISDNTDQDVRIGGYADAESSPTDDDDDEQT